MLTKNIPTKNYIYVYLIFEYGAKKSLLEKEDPETWSNIRVATKYPNISKDFFANKGIQVEAIKLKPMEELHCD